jgi:8-oxo-dGTP diphosphatase
MVTCLASWPTGPVKLEWSPGALVDLPVTGAHGFCFMGEMVVVCTIADRGLSIPGGHIEAGESAEVCFRREAGEEAAAELGDVVLLGHIVTDHSVNPSYQGKYPRRAAQAMFVGSVRRLSQFTPTIDSGERRLVPFDSLPTLHHEWNEVLGAAYAEAVARMRPGIALQETREDART